MCQDFMETLQRAITLTGENDAQQSGKWTSTRSTCPAKSAHTTRWDKMPTQQLVTIRRWTKYAHTSGRQVWDVRKTGSWEKKALTKGMCLKSTQTGERKGKTGSREKKVKSTQTGERQVKTANTTKPWCRTDMWRLRAMCIEVEMCDNSLNQ